jgi:WD40 repeat protein
VETPWSKPWRHRVVAITTFNGHGSVALISGIAFYPDGKTVFTTADDHFVHQWNTETGEQIQAFSGEGKELYGLALSPDGSLLAAGDQDGSIHLWDVASAKALHTISGHAGLVSRLTFNPDGGHLATAGADGSICTYTLQLDQLIPLARARLTRALTKVECQKFLHMGP